MSTCTSSTSRSAIRVGNKSRKGHDVLGWVLHRRNQDHADRAALGQQELDQLVRPALRIPVGVGDQRGQLLNHQHQERVLDRGLVIACDAEQPRLHEPHRVLEERQHVGGGLVGEPVEQPPAEGEFHAAFGSMPHSSTVCRHFPLPSARTMDHSTDAGRRNIITGNDFTGANTAWRDHFDLAAQPWPVGYTRGQTTRPCGVTADP
jgi:hypothetical protein